ncbi:hypothetical protein [Nocardia sp. CA-145437]|uniref:hypothetical protein n=1 Tax=Nocardia sp. CA-145437 TaxID=3239980 RepID=UPI003D969677
MTGPTRRALRAALATFVLVFTALGLTGVPAHAAPTKAAYLHSSCVVKSMVPKGGPKGGPKGDGCDVWGIPQWIGPGQEPQPFPQPVVDLIVGCSVHGSLELVKEAELVEAVPPGWMKYGAGAVIFAAGCVENTVEALIDLGLNSKSPSNDASLGGLNLNDYCARKFNGATAHVRDEHNAFTWECVHGKTSAGGIDIDDQCRHQYGSNAVSGLRETGNAYTWYCRKKR